MYKTTKKTLNNNYFTDGINALMSKIMFETRIINQYNKYEVWKNKIKKHMI